MTIVRRKHLRTAGLCGGGARLWWKRHGLNWNHFVTHGIPADRLREVAPDDAQVELLIKTAERDNG